MTFKLAISGYSQVPMKLGKEEFFLYTTTRRFYCSSSVEERPQRCIVKTGIFHLIGDKSLGSEYYNVGL